MLCGTDYIMHSIPHTQYEQWNISWNIVDRMEHNYGYE